jgi:hypothetical protein
MKSKPNGKMVWASPLDRLPKVMKRLLIALLAGIPILLAVGCGNYQR